MAYVYWLGKRSWLANDAPDRDDAAYIVAEKEMATGGEPVTVPKLDGALRPPSQ